MSYFCPDGQQIATLSNHCELLCGALAKGQVNRQGIYALIEGSMQAALQSCEGLLLAVIDMDDFSRAQGDVDFLVGGYLLRDLAHRACQAIQGPADTLVWLGGDEFLLVLHHLQDASQGLDRVKLLLEALNRPLSWKNSQLVLTASVGMTLYPQGASLNPDQLLRQGQSALYKAKASGRNRCCFYDPVSAYRVEVHQRELDELESALENREFLLFYQPKVNLVSGELLGLEALIRWKHPVEGLLAPGQFLPLLEGEPLELKVGQWVMEAAILQLDVWRQQGLLLPVSINVSGKELQGKAFVDRLIKALATCPEVEPKMLELEILESSILSNMERVCKIISRCQKLGVHFALDDFGTGYSSLSYLKQLPAATVKIDQSFVRGMLSEASDLAILRGVISLSEVFERKVLAEGVETQEHARALVQLGCFQGQGYGIARPMPADEVPAWCQRWLASPWCCA